MNLFNIVAIPLACVSGIWIPAMLLCCIPWVQKQMLYLHWVTFWPGKWLDEPERAGYLKNQVSPFRIPTRDGERLFAWLIAPLGVYARHAADFIAEKSGAHGDIEEKMALRLLRDDPQARLLIYFHGNTGTIAQGRRTEEYRSYSTGASDKIFVLAFDYRGFGKSTGTPSESGLLNDAEAVVDWALNIAQLPQERIVLLGHSLGTAVATGIAHRYITNPTPTQFSGLILCAAFTNSGNAFSAYSIAGVLPVLAPVKLIPAFQTWFSGRMRDTWFTDQRLATIVQRSSNFRLVIVHAQDDSTMPFDQSEELFKKTVDSVAGSSGWGAASHRKRINLGEAGAQEVCTSESAIISKLIAKHGDHNTMMKWLPISLAVLECFDLTRLPEAR